MRGVFYLFDFVPREASSRGTTLKKSLFYNLKLNSIHSSRFNPFLIQKLRKVKQFGSLAHSKVLLSTG